MLSTEKSGSGEMFEEVRIHLLFCSVRWEPPPETELGGCRTLEVPEQKDIQLVQFWDTNKFGQRVLLNLYLAVGQMEGWWLGVLLPTREWRPKVQIRLD